MRNGETYLTFHCARPFVPELRCTLGRETAIQKMEWTDDGWLRMPGGGCLVREETETPALPEFPVAKPVCRDDFDEPVLGSLYYALRIMPGGFADLKARPGWARLRGRESLSSLNKVSLLARKLTSVHARITVKMDYTPEVPQHAAGLALYYDNMGSAVRRSAPSTTLASSRTSIAPTASSLGPWSAFSAWTACSVNVS